MKVFAVIAVMKKPLGKSWGGVVSESEDSVKDD
jgi:hypothetical protein